MKNFTGNTGNGKANCTTGGCASYRNNSQTTTGTAATGTPAGTTTSTYGTVIGTTRGKKTIMPGMSLSPASGTATYPTSENISVPRNYIVGTLCRNNAIISALGVSMFGGTNDSVVSVSKGILLYAILTAGEYEIATYFPAGTTKITNSDVQQVPMDFLPSGMRGSWVSGVEAAFPSGGSTTMAEVLAYLRIFVTSEFFSENATPFAQGTSMATTGNCCNISKGLLLYTLYCEGEAVINHSQTTGTAWSGSNAVSSYSMSFLPAELANIWKTTVTNLFRTNPSAGPEALIQVWTAFITTTVKNNVNKYIAQLTVLLSNTINSYATYGTHDSTTSS